MPNSIEYFKQYVPILDEIYKLNSLSSVLDGNPDLVEAGRNANELVIPKLSMSGLAHYSRSLGYTQGDIDLTYETVKCNYDRGRMFTIDAVDDMEVAGLLYAKTADTFIKEKVVPELDAFRFSQYAQAEGIGTEEEELLTGEAVVEALRMAQNAMDEEEVPTEGRILFITPTLHGKVQDLDTTKSKLVFENLNVVKVPQSRLNSNVVLGEDGFTLEGTPLNFLLIHPTATIQFQKHTAPKVIAPGVNQDADAWKFGYRTVGICDTYENKVKGIFAHKTATV